MDVIPAAFGESRVGDHKTGAGRVQRPSRQPGPVCGEGARGIIPTPSPSCRRPGLRRLSSRMGRDPGVLADANHNTPIWTAPGGYGPLGQALIAQLPKAVRGGMMAPQQLLTAVVTR